MSESQLRVSKDSAGISPVPAQPPTIAAAVKTLRAIGKQLKVTIRESDITLVATQSFSFAHAPIAGIERYKDSDFEAGVPIQAVFVQSRLKDGMPNGAYVVKAQFRRGATEGKAIFVRADGSIAAQRQLIVRDAKQMATVFPDVYPNPISELPVITSSHVWIGDQNHQGESGYGHWGVDCSGWQPFRTLYYW